MADGGAGPTHMPSILWVKSGPVVPATTGGRLRTYEMLRALHQRATVHFLALGQPAPDDPGDYASTIEFVPKSIPRRGSLRFAAQATRNLVSDTALSLARYESPVLARRVKELCDALTPDVVVCDFLTSAPNVPADVRRQSVLFLHNVEALVLARMAAAARSAPARRYLSGQHRRLHMAEGELARQFGRIITVSASDADVARSGYALTNVVGHVPTGVDQQRFEWVRQAPKGSTRLCFLGSMDWRPNVDAVVWFLDNVWPAIVAAVPQASFTVIGRSPPRRLVHAWQGRSGVRFTGTVDDIRPALAGADIAVVPLRVGGGTRLKVLELMAAGIPVVSTTLGIEGLPVVDGRHLLVADSPSELARSVLDLIEHPELGAALSRTAFDQIVLPNDWGSVADRFLELCLAR